MDRHRAAVGVEDTFRRTANTVVVIPLCWIGLFLLAPLASMLSREFSWSSLVDVFASPATRRVLWFSLWQATLSSALTLVVAWPVTWACARYSFAGRRIVRGLVSAPFVLPTVVVAAAIRSLLPEQMATGVAAILLAHVVFNIAVVVRVVGARWERESADLVDIARTLGMSPPKAFATFTVPRLRSSILSAVGVVFVFCFTSFGVVRILGGSRRSTVETEIYFRAVQLGDTSSAVALCVVQVAAVALVMAIVSRHSEVSSSVAKVHTVPAAHFPRRRRLIVASSSVTVLVVSAPFVSMFVKSLRTRTGWSFDPWTRLFDGTFRSMGVDVGSAVANTLVYAAVTVAIALPLALSIASVIAYSPRSTLITRCAGGASLLPLVTSSVILGLGVVITFDVAPIDWRSRWWMLPCMFSVVALPLMVRALVPALRAVPMSWRDAAATLGASPARTWWSVDMRSMRRPIATAVGLGAAVSLGEFGVASFLTRTGHETLPVSIARLLARPGDAMQSSGYALSCLMVVVVVVVMARA